MPDYRKARSEHIYYGPETQHDVRTLRSRASLLVDGRIKPRDIDLDIRVNSDDRSRQRDAREGKFDIAEFFTGIYMADLEYKTLGLTAIPIFVKRMFRHSYIYVNKHAAIRSPKDLDGQAHRGPDLVHHDGSLGARYLRG